jgi:hypothetical protein
MATNPQPSVFGSYNNQYCPRLYSIVKTDAGYYTLAGHPYDNIDAGNSKNIFGLTPGSGAIGNHNPLAPTDDNYKTLSRSGSAGSEQSWWRIVPAGDLTESITIEDIGARTFAYPSDVKIPNGVEAYIAIGCSDAVKLEKIEETIPARQGVVLRRTDNSKNSFDFQPTHGLGIGMSSVGTDGTPPQISNNNNLFVGTLKETKLNTGDYILTKKKVDDKQIDELVFGRISKESNIAANKAYLPKANVQNARSFYALLWDETETGIDNITTTISKDGIYIQNNRIVIIKDGVKYNVNGQVIK